MIPASLRTSRRIARVEFRRSRRALQSNVTQLVLLAIAALFFLSLSLGGALGAYFVGVAIRTGNAAVGDVLGSSGGVVPVARGGFGLAWLAITVFVAARTVSKRGDVSEHEGLLVAASVGDVVVGFAGVEALYYIAWFGLPLGLFVGGFALGARAPSLVLTAPAVVAALLAVGVSGGFALGLAVRHAALVFDPIARHKRALGALAFLAYMGLILTDRLATLGKLLFEPVQAAPVSWLADLFLLGVPGVAPSPLRAGAALLVSGALAVAFLHAATWVADRHWFADPPREDEAAVVESRSAGFGVGGSLGGVVSRPTRSIARVVLVRARRAPITMIYVLWPIFGAISQIRSVIETGTVSRTFPVFMLLYVAWAVGAGLALNPLGNQGAVLPATLTSRVSGRSFVAGHVLAASLVGVPVAVVVVGVSAVASPLSLPMAAVAVGASVVAVVGAATLATGVGTLLPRFGTVKIAGEREAHAPSKLAMAIYSLTLVVGVGAGVGTVWAAGNDGLASLVHVPNALLWGVAVGVLLATLAAPGVAAWYASHRFDRFALD